VSTAAPALEGLVRELEQLLETATPENLPEVLGVLERARARAFERLVTAPASLPEDPLLTIPEVAKRLSIKVSQARELGRRGELPTITVGERFVRVRQSSLDGWIRRREAGGKVNR
jgi:excisionase family DNA binding protein